MTEIEKKAALYLRPYMGKDPVIIDAGSNKGEWAEILAPTVKEIHLFEPNEIFLHYTMVKFDNLSNVVYNSVGLFSVNKISPFYYFTNSNNGLSSVFKNQIWIDMGLPMKEQKINVISLDHYWQTKDYDIDFLKIDVEGADFDVLLGAIGLLRAKRIKFIQIEHSDHIILSGRSWGELVTFVRSLGYDVYDFTGLRFELASEPYGQENYYIMPEITQDWNKEFIKNVSAIPKNFNSEVDYQNYHFKFVLEIGCFEGLTTRYICDNLLSPDGRVICIDPLPDDENTLPFGEDNKIFAGQYGRFARNTNGYPVELIRKKSREVMTEEGFRHYRFDLIYIDGDHREDEVFNDGVMSFEVCRKGGYILFDDYGWREETARGIDRFLGAYGDYLRVLVKDYQVLVQKIS